MESVKVKDPGNGKITNRDNAVTNKDSQDNPEKGEQPVNQKKADAMAPSNDNPELYEPANESSNKGQGPAGENL
jgi:hypothetical protein